ncbi:hypothetical protein HHK36_013436 [Tetracentron sinense]|uniref:Aminotransferase-like plant mobile domain-containing protein n=1 Tax=Tetracentron sinense TaxID=13715 RepID=A0A834Z6A4_TETSI|nr:hypothetical protein HHK36_013436 [Tetracentron sinense]
MLEWSRGEIKRNDQSWPGRREMEKKKGLRISMDARSDFGNGSTKAFERKAGNKVFGGLVTGLSGIRGLNMGRSKKVKIGESSSACTPIDEDYVPPMDVEEQPREISQVGASSSRAEATSSKGRKKLGSDSVPVMLGVPDTPLLKGLGGHILAIFRTQEVLEILYHGLEVLVEAYPMLYQRASASLKDSLGRTPLGPFLTIPWIQSDRRLVAALCETWLLAFSPETVTVDSVWEAGKVKLSWLAGLLEDTDIVAINLNSLIFTIVLRIFLLYVLGSCFFMTDHSCVETSLLSLMDPIDRFDTFDWGGAIYANILAGLHRVSLMEGRSVRFFYHFLEVTLRPYSDLGDLIMLSCRGARCFMGRRVAFSYLGICEYFLGEWFLHQSDGEFWIPLAPPSEMTPVLAHDAFMEQLCMAGIAIHHLVGEVLDHSFYLSWLWSVSISPIMRPFSTRPVATEVRGKLVEKYFQMRLLLSILEEDTQGLTEEIARLIGWFATFENPLVTLEAVPPYQCRPHLDMSFDFEAGPTQVKYSVNKTMRRTSGCLSALWYPKAGATARAVAGLKQNSSCPKALKLGSKVLSTHPDAMEPSIRGNDDSAFAFQTLPNLENHRLYNQKVKRWLDSLDSSEQEAFQKLKLDYFSPRNSSWISTPSFVGLPGSWPQYRFHALALAVVGHVLFPLSFNFIDMQIWLLEHLKFYNPLATPAFMRWDLIKSHCAFSEIPPILDSPEMWYDQLVLLAPKMLVWKCSWLHVVEILSGTFGKHHIIPIGLRGSNHYLPNLKSRAKNTFGDDQDSLATIEYIRWLGVCYPPYVSPSQPCTGDKRKEPINVMLIEDQPLYKELEEKVTSLLAENAGLKTEVSKMGSEAVAYQDRIKDLKAQIGVLETVNEEF